MDKRDRENIALDPYRDETGQSEALSYLKVGWCVAMANYDLALL